MLGSVQRVQTAGCFLGPRNHHGLQPLKSVRALVTDHSSPESNNRRSLLLGAGYSVVASSSKAATETTGMPLTTVPKAELAPGLMISKVCSLQYNGVRDHILALDMPSMWVWQGRFVKYLNQCLLSTGNQGLLAVERRAQVRAMGERTRSKPSSRLPLPTSSRLTLGVHAVASERLIGPQDRQQWMIFSALWMWASQHSIQVGAVLKEMYGRVGSNANVPQLSWRTGCRNDNVGERMCARAADIYGPSESLIGSYLASHPDQKPNVQVIPP